MKIVRRNVGTVDVYAPQDALVDEKADEFIHTLEASVRAPNARVVVDMNEVGYMDSEALEGLTRITDELAERSQQLKLAAVTPTCREILALTGLGGRFQFFDGVDAAVRSFL